MLWVNLIMDTFAAMALSSLPANKRVLNEKPRNPESHIINRQMLFRIIGIGSVFFVALAGLWQLLWHTDITCVRDLLTIDAAKLFVSGFADLSHTKAHLSGYEMGVFFSVFVMLQFWNLFNAKYYRTDRSFILDIIDFFRRPSAVKESFSSGFIWISLVIVIGQILIVTFAGRMFNVSPLAVNDWLWIMFITLPVLVFGDILRLVRMIFKKQ
jgi:Ca2+-transporting ATPase